MNIQSVLLPLNCFLENISLFDLLSGNIMNQQSTICGSGHHFWYLVVYYYTEKGSYNLKL